VPVLTNTVNAEICAGGSYTLPDGSIVNTAGSYDVTLTSIAGCDSIVTTILDVVPVITNTVNAEICAGGSYTLPDGSIVNTAGSYDVTLASIAGCDSIVTTVVLVYPNYAITISSEICAGESYLLPDGSSVNQSGTYDVILNTAYGCDSLITTVIEVHPLITSNVNAQICAGSNYTLPDGIVVSASGIYTSTLTAVTGCDSLVITSLNVVDVIYTNETVSLCQGETYVLPNGQSVSTSGVYSSILTSASGCDSIVTSTINVNPIYTVIENFTICSDEFVILPNGTQVNTTGSYTTSLLSIFGCDSTIVTNVVVLPIVGSTVVAEICGNESYSLPDGFVVNSSGIYETTLTAISGCDSIVTTNLTVHPVYSVAIDAVICIGETYMLPSGLLVSTNGDYVSNLTTNYGCDSIVTTHLQVIDVVPNILNISGTNTLTCDITEIQLQANGGTSYSWNNGLFDGNTLFVVSPGVYEVVVTEPNGCSDSISVVIDQDITPPVAGILNVSNATLLTCALTEIQLMATGGGQYNWNSGLSSSDQLTVSSPGDYTVVVTANNGCTDSEVITIEQNIDSPAPTLVFHELCQGESVVLQDGSIASVSGVYNVVLEAWNGCDSLIINDVLVHPTYYSTQEVWVCPDESFTLPNGAVIIEAGDYPLSYTTIFGCDSTVVWQLNILPVGPFYQEVNICSGESYILPDGAESSTAGIYNYTLVSSLGCDSLVTIELNVVEPVTIHQNISICPGGTYTLPDGNIVATTGNYSVMLQSIYGCDSLVVSHVLILPPQQSYVNAHVCFGTAYLLPDGVEVSTSGTYTSMLTNEFGCDSMVYTTLAVDPPITVGIIPVADTLQICFGDSVQLSAFGASDLLWTPNNDLSIGTGPSTWASPLESSTIQLYGSQGLCESIDSVYIEVLPLPVIDFNAEELQVCEGDSIALSLTGADEYEWDPSPYLDCLDCAEQMIVPGELFTLTVTGELNGCVSSASIDLGIMPNPVTIIAGDSILCGVESTTLTALGASDYEWNTGDTTNTIVVSPLDDEVYYVLGSIGDCLFPDDILIEVHDLPVIDAGPDTLIYMGDFVTLTPSGGVSYSWDVDATLSCLDCENPEAAPPVTTIYCVEGYDEFGCADTSCVKVEVTIDCPTFFIPNAFAPEEGGHTNNDCFRVYGQDCFATFMLRVYDRWGEIVFETSDPEACWDGTFNGKKVNSGVFVYQLQAELLTGEPFYRKGNVTLMR
ncbi:MAG: gliding motility-associated C-terminal domain-containing protein, partial [Flavobacteriales bacterium]